MGQLLLYAGVDVELMASDVGTRTSAEASLVQAISQRQQLISPRRRGTCKLGSGYGLKDARQLERSLLKYSNNRNRYMYGSNGSKESRCRMST